MKIRVRFEKEGSLRFVGHLDIMRYFHKAFQRANIPVSFSAGYHPHPIMSFASPLGVGLTSRGEYLDVDVEECGSEEEMLARLNAVMGEEIRVTGCRRLTEEGRRNNAMALVGIADYRVWLTDSEKEETSFWEESIRRFLAQPEIQILRKTKKGEQETDIRPWIYEFRYEEPTHSFFMHLSAGSLHNLKPELVMQAFLHFLGKEYTRTALTICRLDMMTAEGVSLGALGEKMP